MNIGEVLNEAYKILKSSNIDTYMLDSQLLLQKILEKDRLFIILNREFNISKEKQEEYFKLIDMRKRKMPVKYILGECEFMGLNFKVTEGVLIPRSDTEILVEETINIIKENKYIKISDVCCGSGAIGISIGSFLEKVKVSCYDISDVAVKVTQENIGKFNLDSKVKVFKSDLLGEAIKMGEKFDVIVSNPPYIKEDVIPTLMEDVKNYEPYIALCGGRDGLEFYRKITKQSIQVLNKGGMIGYEVGYDQKDLVISILEDNGFTDIRCIKDLAGLDRVVIGFY